MNGMEATVAGGEVNKLISEAIKTISNIKSVGDIQYKQQLSDFKFRKPIYAGGHSEMVYSF